VDFWREFLAERREPPGESRKRSAPPRFTAKPKALAGRQSENTYVERFRKAGPAVAYGSAVNEDGGKRGRRLTSAAGEHLALRIGSVGCYTAELVRVDRQAGDEIVRLAIGVY
jgi:hypothetical protein